MTDSSRSLLPVQVGRRWLALDATAVVEVLGAQPWVPIPGGTAEVPGVISWRGRAIAVLDLGALAGLGPALAPGRVLPRSIVVEARGEVLALPVRAVRETCEADDRRLQAMHATQVRFAIGEIRIAGMTMPILDLDAAVAAFEPAEGAR